MNGNIFIVNFKKLVVWLLPAPLRRPVQSSWLMALIGPVIKLYNGFLAFRSAVIYQLTITPQVCKLEKMLNDRYDNQLRRIYIEDAIEKEPWFLYLKVEAKRMFLYTKSEASAPQYLYTKSETVQFGVDFVINIPVFVVFDINEFKSLVKKYKLASKTFKVHIV